jgi:hypothetical protein
MTFQTLYHNWQIITTIYSIYSTGAAIVRFLELKKSDNRFAQAALRLLTWPGHHVKVATTWIKSKL